MTPLGEFRPYPKSAQARAKGGIPTKADKAAASKKQQAEGLRVSTDKQGRVVCFICAEFIKRGERIEWDHVLPRSRGKISTIQRPTHAKCHQQSHVTPEGQRVRRAKAQKELR